MAGLKPSGLDLTLDSARLRLRAMLPSDQDALLRLAGDYEIARHTRGIPHPYGAVEAAKYLDHAVDKFRRGDAFSFAITRREDGTFLGGADLTPRLADGIEIDGELELGYWIGKSFQGQGFAAEAAKRLLAFAVFDLAAGSVVATVARDNIASINVLQKLDMRLRRRGVEFWPAREAEVEFARFAIRAADIRRSHEY
jgi:RimJ/RimL family protein N-acetyltransferase